MIEQKVIISVEDRIDSNISKKIDTIAASAKAAAPAIGGLRDALKEINNKSIKSAFKEIQGVKDSIKAITQLQVTESKKAAILQESLNRMEILQKESDAKVLKLKKESNAKILISKKKLASDLEITESESQSKIWRLTNESLNRIERLRNESNSRTLRASTLLASRMYDNERKMVSRPTVGEITRSSGVPRPTGGLVDQETALSVPLDRPARESRSSIGIISAMVKGHIIYRAIAELSQLPDLIKDLSDSYTSLQNKLQLVTTSQSQLNVASRELFDIANRSRVSVDEVATAFQRFDMALVPLGASQMEVLQLTETISKALTLSGASTSEQTQGLRQLSQAFNKGKLDGDEFRTVMETMPLLAQAIADKLGVQRGELLKLAPQGKITAQIMRESFRDAAYTIETAFEKTPPTIGQSFKVLRNLSTELVGEVDKNTNSFTELSRTVIDFAMSIRRAMPDVVYQVSLLTNGVVDLLIAGKNVAKLFASFIPGSIKEVPIAEAFGDTAVMFKALFADAKDMKGILDAHIAKKDEMLKKRNEEIALQKQLIELERKLRSEKDENVRASLRKEYDRLKGHDLLRPESPRVAAGESPVGVSRVKATNYMSISDVWNKLNAEFEASRALGEMGKIEKQFIEIREKLEKQLKDAIRDKRPNTTIIKEQLTAYLAQETSIKEQIRLTEHNKLVQAESVKIMNEGRDAIEKYAITEEALNKLHDAGSISMDNYTIRIGKNSKELEYALNPIQKYIDELDDLTSKLGLSSREMEILEARQRLVNAGFTSPDITKYIMALAEVQKIRTQGNISTEIKDFYINENALERMVRFTSQIEKTFKLYSETKDVRLSDLYSQLKKIGAGDLLKGSYLELESYRQSLYELKLQYESLKESFKTTGDSDDTLIRNFKKLSMSIKSEELLSKMSSGVSKYFDFMNMGKLEAIGYAFKELFMDISGYIKNDMLGNWKGGLYEMAIATKDFTQSALSGFSDVMAQWIWMGESARSIGEMLGDLARQILKELTSKLILNSIMKLFDMFSDKSEKTGDEIGANTAVQLGAIGALTGANLASITTISAAQVAAGAAITSAMAPAALAASLATSGANGALAATGITTAATALSAAMTGSALLNGVTSAGALQGTAFANGGLVKGNEQLIRVNELGEEFVMNHKSTNMYRPMLESMNKGVLPVGNVNVVIENHGTNKEFEVQQLSPNDVRVIARDEIRSSVPGLIANEVANPNSRVSKTMGNFTKLQRRML